MVIPVLIGVELAPNLVPERICCWLEEGVMLVETLRWASSKPRHSKA